MTNSPLDFPLSQDAPDSGTIAVATDMPPRGEPIQCVLLSLRKVWTLPFIAADSVATPHLCWYWHRQQNTRRLRVSGGTGPGRDGHG